MNRSFFSTLWLLVFLVLVSCVTKNPFPGYSLHKEGFYFKLIKIGEGHSLCKFNDYITVDIDYRTLKDSIFFKGRRKFQILKPTYNGSIDRCLTLLGKGDSASFIVSAQTFFARTLSSQVPSFLEKNGKMKINVLIDDIQTPKEYENEKEAFINWVDDFGDYEKVILKQYLEHSKLNVKPLSNGLYYICLKKGNNVSVSLGDTVVVDYEGKFLNGKFFDSTKERHEPFQFVYGQQWQVIKGMEEAIGLMHEGEKALFIMPSDLAFGKTGSSTGIVPPFTSLIYEVHLLSVHKI